MFKPHNHWSPINLRAGCHALAIAVSTAWTATAQAQAEEGTSTESWCDHETACANHPTNADQPPLQVTTHPISAPSSAASPTCEEGSAKCVTSDGRVIDVSPDYAGPQVTSKRWLHGFRVGAIYVYNLDKPTDDTQPDSSLSERYDLKSPWMFALGYEGMRRIVGHSWLNVILVGNVTVAGLEQSKFIPSMNGLVGFEFHQSFQVGVGANFTPEDGKALHMIAAAGWTPRIGSFYMPVHFTVVPDVDGNHRLGSTVGVNW
jgi:hypothetical protein